MSINWNDIVQKQRDVTRERIARGPARFASGQLRYVREPDAPRVDTEHRPYCACWMCTMGTPNDWEKNGARNVHKNTDKSCHHPVVNCHHKW